MFWDSSEETVINTKGPINNNLLIQGESIDHVSNEITIMVGIICAIKIIEVIIYGYRALYHSIKKKHQPRTGP